MHVFQYPAVHNSFLCTVWSTSALSARTPQPVSPGPPHSPRLIADKPSNFANLCSVLRNNHGREMGCCLSDRKAERDASPALAGDHQGSLQLLSQRTDQAELERVPVVDIEVRRNPDSRIADGQGHLSRRLRPQRDRYGPYLVRR
jgi:hypothetical protein